MRGGITIRSLQLTDQNNRGQVGPGLSRDEWFINTGFGLDSPALERRRRRLDPVFGGEMCPVLASSPVAS